MPSATRVEAGGARRDRTPLYLFLCFQALYALTASGNTFRIADEFEVYFQTERLVDAGDLSVPQALAIQQPVIVDGRVVGREPIFFGKVGRDGKPYAPYGPLTALLAVPHHLAARAIAGALGVPRPPQPQASTWMFLVAGLTSLAASTAAALAVAGFYRAAVAMGASPGPARTLALLLGGATVLWPYGKVFFSEAFTAAALIWAAALLLEARLCAARDATPARARVAGAACLLLVSGLTKSTAFIFAPAFVVGALAQAAVWRARRPSSAALPDDEPLRGDAVAGTSVAGRSQWRAALLAAVALAAGAGLAIAGHLAWNAYRFGDPFDIGYDVAETIPIPPFRPFALDELPRGLAVLLLSPGKSLLLWAPPLLLALTRARRLWQHDRAVAAGLLAGLAAALLFFGSYAFPEGGYSHGPRHLVPLVPLLLLAAATPAAPPPSRAAIRACAIAGASVALLAVCVSFLEDQSLGQNLAGQPRTGYYARVTPAPGRPWNRYALDYLPFVRTLSSPSAWLAGTTVGKGPDFLPYHLTRVRQLVPGGDAIPAWLPIALPLPWLLLLIWSARRLVTFPSRRL